MAGLILSRKPGEQIVIGDAITVTVLDWQKGQARLQVVAPREVSVHRAEVAERIADEERVVRSEERGPEAA